MGGGAVIDFNAKVRDLLGENDQLAADLCQNYKALGIHAYFVRLIDETIETDAQNVRIIGPIHEASADVFRRGASLCERYLREKAKAN